MKKMVVIFAIALVFGVGKEITLSAADAARAAADAYSNQISGTISTIGAQPGSSTVTRRIFNQSGISLHFYVNELTRMTISVGGSANVSISSDQYFTVWPATEQAPTRSNSLQALVKLTQDATIRRDAAGKLYFTN